MAKIVTPKGLGAALRAEGEGVLKDIRRGARSAAHRGRALLVAETNRKGITDRGQYKNSFKVLAGADPATGGDPSKTLAALINDAPYAGIIELGAPPHAVSPEGRELILAWAQRKLGLYEKEAQAVLHAVVKKLAEQGQQPRLVVAEAIPQLREFLQEEIEALIRKRASGGAKGGTP